MRLLPSLLAAAQRNQARGFAEGMLFEIGAQFQTGVPEAQTNIAAGTEGNTACNYAKLAGDSRNDHRESAPDFSQQW